MENGTYAARPTGRIEVGEHENGCLIVSMEFATEAESIGNIFWLTTKDGAVNTKTVETLKTVFGWDGADPFWFEENAEQLQAVDVELVVENESFVGQDGNTHVVPRVQWVNKPGGGRTVKIANKDRKSVLAKYGAKLRSVSGTPVKPAKPQIPATPPPAAPPTKPQPPEQPEETGSSTMEFCWNKLLGEMAGNPRQTVENKWFEILSKTNGDKPNSDYTPQDWAKVDREICKTFQLPF